MHDFILSPLSLKDLEILIFNQVRKALTEIHEVTNDPVKDELLTIEAAATLLSVTVPTVYGYVHQRAIPCMKRRAVCIFQNWSSLPGSNRQGVPRSMKSKRTPSPAWSGNPPNP